MIEVFEMWLWRRVLRVSWQERTNEWVRDRVQVPPQHSMLEQMKIRKMRKYSHWKRRGDSLVIATKEGEVCAKGRRRRTEWIDNVSEWMGRMEGELEEEQNG